MREKLREEVNRVKAGVRLSAEATVAGELMDAGCARLEASQSLGEALEKLCRNRVPELPVVDEDGCLVGTFTAEDALQMCVPEHLLWADELPQMECIENLAEGLKSEIRRPLAEVVLVGGKSLTVSESTPLAQVARLMAKHAARQVMVVERRELRGVVTAQDVISRVLGH